MKKLMLLIVFILFTTVSFAETIKLKNGDVVEGAIIERTDDEIKINHHGIKITYWLDEVESISGDQVANDNLNFTERSSDENSIGIIGNSQKVSREEVLKYFADVDYIVTWVEKEDERIMGEVQNKLSEKNLDTVFSAKLVIMEKALFLHQSLEVPNDNDIVQLHEMFIKVSKFGVDAIKATFRKDLNYLKDLNNKVMMLYEEAENTKSLILKKYNISENEIFEILHSGAQN